MVTTAGEQGDSIGSLSGFPNLSRAGKTNPCTLRSAARPSVCDQDIGHHRSPVVNGREGSDVIFANSLKEQLCCVFFTKSIHTAWEHWHCSFWAAWQSQSVQASPAAPLQESHKGQQSLSMAEHSQDFWEQSLLWRAAAGPGCSTMPSQSSLALLLLACPHLVLAWLCSPALLWTCLLSLLHFNLHSCFHSGTALPLAPGISQCTPGPSICWHSSHCRCGWWGWYSSGQQPL